MAPLSKANPDGPQAGMGISYPMSHGPTNLALAEVQQESQMQDNNLSGPQSVGSSQDGLSQRLTILKQLLGNPPGGRVNELTPNRNPNVQIPNGGQGGMGVLGGSSGQNTASKNFTLAELQQQRELSDLHLPPGLGTQHPGGQPGPDLPSIGVGFAGMDFTASGVVPPDMDAAAGPNQIVETVNNAIDFYDKATGSALLAAAEPLRAFFAPTNPGSFLFDPVVNFDEQIGRFYVAALDVDFNANTSFLDLAVSNDANPLDGFQAMFKISTKEVNSSGTALWSDFTRLGWNHDAIVFTFNMYSFSTNTYDHVQVLSIDKSTLAGLPSIFTVDRTGADFSMAPATMHGSATGDPMWFVEEASYADGGNIQVVRMDNVLSKTPTFSDTVLAVNPYTLPPAAQEPGGGLMDTNDARILNAEFRGGRLVAAQTVNLGDGLAHARWYEIDTTGSAPTLVSEGDINPGNGSSTYFPSIAIQQGDTLGMTYLESGPNEFVSMYVTGKTSTDSTMEPATLAKAGESIYAAFDGSPYRAGDYSGISVDPSGFGFTAVNEYANSLPFNNWGTWISNFHVAMQVVTTNPASQQLVTSVPAAFDIFFSNPFDPGTVDLTKFDVNGVHPDSSTAISPTELELDYVTTPNPVTTEGPQTITVAAGAVKRVVDEEPVQALSATFFFDPHPMVVDATTPTNGSIVALPFTNLVVHFNEAFNPATVSVFNLFTNQGTVTAATVIDAQTVDYTIAGLTDETTPQLTVLIPFGALTDTNGDPAQPFSGSYTLDIPTTPYPGPQINAKVYSGFTFGGGGAPYSGLVGSFTSSNIQFASNTGYNWHPFGLFQFGADLMGGLTVAADGTYTFTLNSDAGSELFIDGNLVVNDGGFHGPQTVSGSTLLTTGTHSFEVQFFSCCGGPSGVDLTLPSGVSYTPPLLQAQPPAGSLVYDPSASDTVNFAGDTESYTLAVDAGQTITVLVTPATGSTLQPSITLTDPSNNTLGTAGASAAGANALLQTIHANSTGTYTVGVGGASGSTGSFTVQIILNAAVEAEEAIGASNDTIATAQDLAPAFLDLNNGAARAAVLGQIHFGVSPGDVFFTERTGGFGGDVAHLNNAGKRISSFSNPAFGNGVLSAVQEGINNDLYVGLELFGSPFFGELLHFDYAGNLLNTVSLPPDVGGFFFFEYPFGFAVAPDGTLWVPQPNSGHVLHLDANGNTLQSFYVGNTPEDVAIRADGQIFIANDGNPFAFPANGEVQQLDPSSGSVTTFENKTTLPAALSFRPNGNLWVADDAFFAEAPGEYRFDSSGNVLQFIASSASPTKLQVDQSNNLFVTQFLDGVQKYDPAGNLLVNAKATFPVGLTVIGIDGPTPPPTLQPDPGDFYSLSLDAGQSATLALKVLNSLSAHIDLFDGNGNPLALGAPVTTNVDEVISNFRNTTGAAATFYVEVTGTLGVGYNLVVTRNLDFKTGKHSTQVQAQGIAGTGGVLGALLPASEVQVGTNFDGLNSNDSGCLCFPPDGALAVGNGFVMEGVNIALRVTDLAGHNLLTEQLSTFFSPLGTGSFGDPYIVYDDLVNRWYVLSLDGSLSGINFAVSNDANPLDGFSLQKDFTLGFVDFPKMGFNADAIVITGNNFSLPGVPLQGISIDKSQLLMGNIVSYTWQRDSSHFRAEVPAWMHGSLAGDPMYLVEEAGYENGMAARVVTMTNILSTSPTFVDTDIPVNAYSFPGPADQPGQPGSVTTNDTTFTRADWRNGLLESAQSASEPGGDAPSHVHWYEFSTSGTPSLVQQGIIDPGPGISTYFGTLAINANGDLGLTYMESSSSQFVSMYVTGRLASDPPGTMSLGTPVAPGIRTGDFGRAGDYSGIAVDPADGTTFWVENEYQGNAFWNTYVASFQLVPPLSQDWYSFSANAGDDLTVSTTIPASDPSGQFANKLIPTLDLVAPDGSVTTVDGLGGSINVPSALAGTYFVRVYSKSATLGEYVLHVQGATGAPAFTVAGTNPASGAVVQPPTTMTVTFNQGILLPSLSPADFTIDGINATSVTPVDWHTVTIGLPGLAAGDRVTHTLDVSSAQDLQGTVVTPFQTQFITDTVGPTVVATSIEEGDSLPAGSLTYTVSFSEPMDTTQLAASSFDLHGDFRNADYAPASFSFDATATALTITYTNLPDDQYTLTLFSALATDGSTTPVTSGFRDLVGLALDGEPAPSRPPSVPSGDGVPGGNFFVDFSLDTAADVAFPTPLASKPPAGSLVYDPVVTGTIAPKGDNDSYTIALDATQTLTVDVTPDQNLTPAVVLTDPNGNIVDASSATNPGQDAILQTEPISFTGTYRVTVLGHNHTVGLYHLQLILNAALEEEEHGGGSNDSPATAQDLSNSFVDLGNGAAKGGVLGEIHAGVAPGDLFFVERNPGLIGGDIVHLTNAGQKLGSFTSPLFNTNNSIISAVEEGQHNDLWVGLEVNFSRFQGELLHFDYAGNLLGAPIALPPDSGGFSNFIYPFGFAAAADGTFWVPQPNSGNVLHLNPDGSLIQSFFVGNTPEDVAIRSDGQIFIANVGVPFAFLANGQVRQLDPNTGTVTTFESITARPVALSFRPDGNLWVSDDNSNGPAGEHLFDRAGHQQQYIPGSDSTTKLQVDQSNNLFVSTFFPSDVQKYDPSGKLLIPIPATNPVGLTVIGIDGPSPPVALLPDPGDFYSFSLAVGQSATISLKVLSGGKGQIALFDSNGNPLALETPIAFNVDGAINNFTNTTGSPTIVYVKVTGDEGVQYNLVVTKGADFKAGRLNGQDDAQNVAGTGQVLGALVPQSEASLGVTPEGVGFEISNCSCLPPDPTIAVGPNNVVELAKSAMQIYDTAGNLLSYQTLQSFFAPLGSTFLTDPQVAYDDIAQRWYVSVLDAHPNQFSDVLFAASNDANPLDGFTEMHRIHLSINDFIDFQKMGFNHDAVVITGNDFYSGFFVQSLTVIAIDKSTILDQNNSTFTDYITQLKPGFPNHFRAEVPAEMHGSLAGDPMFLVSENGYGNGSAARVTTMTNILSSSPVFTDTVIPVNPYGFPPAANQPGDPFSVVTNDTTFTRADWRNGLLVSAQSVSEPDDNFSTSRVRWYEFSAPTDGTPPSLIQQGSIHPGPGISTYFGTVAIDAAGNLGLTYMESSATEFVSMYVTGRLAADPPGTLAPGTLVRAGVNTGYSFFLAGDYSGINVAPDGETFWAVNEYKGNSSFWNTALASFQIVPPIPQDWYRFSAGAGDNLTISTTIPAADPSAQFANPLIPTLDLVAPDGSTTTVDGRGGVINVPSAESGTYLVRVYSLSGTLGEYVLQVQGATGPLPSFDVTSTDPANGAFIQPPSTMTVTFDQSILLSPLSNADFTIDGSSATGFTAIDYHTVVFDLPALAAGESVTHSVRIGGIQDVQGTILMPFQMEFTSDSAAPTVVATSIEEGNSLPVGGLTYTATFSEPMDTTRLAASSFNLHGDFRNVDYAPASFGFDPTGTVLTITYNNLPDDGYTLTLESALASDSSRVPLDNGFRDLVGLALDGESPAPRPPSVPSGDGVAGGNFFVDFSLQQGPGPFPVPLSSKPPLGGLVYDPTATNAIGTPGEQDIYTINLDAGQLLTLVVHPDYTLQPNVSVTDPNGNVFAETNASSGPGQDAVLQTLAITTPGLYTLTVGGANSTAGLYMLQVILNAAVKLEDHGGPQDETTATAQDLSGNFLNLGNGAARAAVLGRIRGPGLSVGDVFESVSTFGFGSTGGNVVHFDNNLNALTSFSGPNFTNGQLGDVELGPNNDLWVAVNTNFSAGQGELDHFSDDGTFLQAVPLPNDTPFRPFPFVYPFGFDVAADRTFWVAQPNTGNVLHLSSSGAVLNSFHIGGHPEDLAVGPDGLIYGVNPTIFDTFISTSYVFTLDPNTGAVKQIVSGLQFPDTITFTADGSFFWINDQFLGQTLRYDLNGNLQQSISSGDPVGVESDPSGNVFVASGFHDTLKFDPSGNLLNFVFNNGVPIGVTIPGTDMPITPIPADFVDTYSFSLSAGQTVTLTINALSSGMAHLSLLAPDGNTVLATGTPVGTNVDEAISNFVASASGTYYVQVTGDTGVQYNLGVTKGALFDIEPNDNPLSAQALDSLNGGGGVLGAIEPPTSQSSVTQNFIGLDTGLCFCEPPDTMAAAGPQLVVETVNTSLRITDKMGNIVAPDQSFGAFFSSVLDPNTLFLADPVVAYDEQAGRFFVGVVDVKFNPYYGTDFLYAQSVDSNPQDGWTNFENYNFGSLLSDFPRVGWNADAHVFSLNMYNPGNGFQFVGATVLAIDKNQPGTNFFIQDRSTSNFTLAPATMHGSVSGGPMYFVESIPLNRFTGGTADTIDVVREDYVLSGTPTFTDTLVPVDAYSGPPLGPEPFGFQFNTNDDRILNAEWRDGLLVADHAIGTGDGLPHARWYEFNTIGTPTLVQQGTINRGPGTGTFFPAIAINANDELGLTFLESSASEFVSMYVTGHAAFTPPGTMGTPVDVRPGQFPYFGARGGDFAGIVVDPSDNTSFWAANEWVPFGPPWSTNVSQFNVQTVDDQDWYSVTLAANAEIMLSANTPAGGPGEFVNNLVPHINLYDAYGNLVASADGAGTLLDYIAVTGGTYHIQVTGDNHGSGEYFLSQTIIPSQTATIGGQVINDLSGSGVQDPGDPGLNRWVVDLFNASGALVQQALTVPVDLNNDGVKGDQPNETGYYFFNNLPAGSYTLGVEVKPGWVQTFPGAPGTLSVTVAANQVVLGQNLGVFHTVTLSGEAYNDSNGDGSKLDGDLGIPNLTIDLLNSSGAQVASTATDANGNYSFTGVGPGTFTIQEVVPAGAILTQPGFPGTYTITANSGTDVSGNDFGNFQTVTLSGEVYNDLNGDGVLDNGEPGLSNVAVELISNSTGMVQSTTTDSSGNYSFSGVGPGTFTIEELLPSGYVFSQPAAPFTYTVTTSSGTNVAGLDFGNFFVSLSGQVYNDLNGDGVLDDGELGLPNVTVLLFNDNTGAVQTTTTDANGNYSFSGVGSGTFTIAEQPPPGTILTQPSFPLTYTVTTGPTNVTNLDFGNFTTVTLTGEAFNDINGDGSQQSGEPGMAGVTIQLTDTFGNVFTTTTDANGNYTFFGVGPGTFTLRELVPAGYVETRPAATVTTQNGTNVDGLDFGNFKLVTLAGEVFTDTNGDGILEAGEPGLSGVTVNLLQNGSVLASTISDTNGNYSFPNVGPGTFVLQELVPSGYVQTDPTPPGTYTVPTTSGIDEGGLNFGNFQTASVSGEVYNDLNGDGSRIDGDQGIPDVAVELLNSAGSVVQTTTTDGNYSFTSVGPGSYTVEEVLPSGWIFTQPASPYTYSFTPTSGQTTTGDDFGNFQLVTVSGTVYNDKDDNHIQDSGDPGIANVTIQLDGVNSATTDASGNYSISGIGPGSHTVSEVIPSAYIATAPASATFTFTAQSGGNQTDNFANALPTETLDNGQPGYSEHGANWHTLAQGWNGTSRTHTATSSTNINASWNLHDPRIPSVTYEVFVTYVPGASRTTVKYQVQDGNTLRETVTVDQTQTPSDGTYQGVAWKSLGPVLITHGRLFVRMIGTVTDASKTMDADGVLLIPDPSSSAPGQPSQPIDGTATRTVTSGTPIAATRTQSPAALVRSSASGFTSSFVSSLPPSSGSAAATQQLLASIFATMNQPADSQVVPPSTAASQPTNNRTVAAGSNSMMPGALMVGGQLATYRDAVDTAFSLIHHSAPTNQWDDLVDFLAQNQVGNSKKLLTN